MKLFTNQKEIDRAIKAAVDQANKVNKRPTHVHRGNPPLSGSKYIITGWLEFGSETI